MPLSQEKKDKYFAKLKKFMGEFNKCFLVTVDNVGSKQMANIRYATRGKCEILMGKNTMIRKIINDYLVDHPDHGFKQILPLMVGNTGFVFTNGDLGEVKTILEENRVPAPARAGAIAPVKVVVPSGPTGCDPGQTSFFQALQIATKIAKGQIEILNDVNLVDVGEKVGASEAALLQ
jgi:large subunit ribosomal protein LP0